MAIRHMRRQDVPSVMASIAREFAFDAKQVEPRIRAAIKGRPEHLERIRRPNLVLEIDEIFAGYVSVKPFEISTPEFDMVRDRGMTAVLVQVAVEPAYRGSGGGTALADAALSGCREAGYSQVFAHIVEEHSPFYRALGFDVPDAGFGWAWIEERTLDDVNLMHKLGHDVRIDDWVPILVETPSVGDYPILARLLIDDLPASVAFDPGPAASPGPRGVAALARHIENTHGWDRIPNGAAAELKKSLN